MSNVQEGLEEVSAEEVDINTEAGFQAALAKQTGGTVPEGAEPSDTSIESGLVETAAEEQPPEEEAPPAEEETPSEEEQPPAQDPEIAAYLEKFGGDQEKALRAAVEAQSLIGRQGNELGQLREQIAKIEGRLDEQPPAPLPTPGDSVMVELENMIESNGGRATLEWVNENRPDLIEPAIAAWVESGTDPGQATMMAARYAAWQAEQARAEQAPKEEPQSDDFIEKLRVERQMGELLTEAQTKVSADPEFQGVEWDVLKEHLVPALTEADPLVQNAVMSADLDLQKQGVNVLLQLARGRVIRDATTRANQERQESTTDAKKAATVASGSLRPATKSKSPDGQLSRDEAIAELQERILKADTTSVQEGLTYAK